MKQDECPNSHLPADTQRRGCWSRAELERLKTFAVRKRPTKHELAAAFPGRTVAAIKLKLFMTRRELGVAKVAPRCEHLLPQTRSVTMLDKADPGVYAPSWQDQQRPMLERGNAAFLAALAQAA